MILANTVFFDDIVHVLVAAAGEVDQHRAVIHALRQLDAVGNGVCALDGGDDTLQTGQIEEGVDGVVVADDVVLDAAKLVQERVLRAGGGVVQTGRD